MALRPPKALDILDCSQHLLAFLRCSSSSDPMILVSPPMAQPPQIYNPNMSKMPQSFAPNLTCLAMPLQHGAVGDDIGFDLRLQRSNYVELLCYVVANESKACFSEEEKHGKLSVFLNHQGGIVDFPIQPIVGPRKNNLTT